MKLAIFKNRRISHRGFEDKEEKDVQEILTQDESHDDDRVLLFLVEKTVQEVLTQDESQDDDRIHHLLQFLDEKHPTNSDFRSFEFEQAFSFGSKFTKRVSMSEDAWSAATSTTEMSLLDEIGYEISQESRKMWDDTSRAIGGVLQDFSLFQPAPLRNSLELKGSVSLSCSSTESVELSVSSSSTKSVELSHASVARHSGKQKTA